MVLENQVIIHQFTMNDDIHARPYLHDFEINQQCILVTHDCFMSQLFKWKPSLSSLQCDIPSVGRVIPRDTGFVSKQVLYLNIHLYAALYWVITGSGNQNSIIFIEENQSGNDVCNYPAKLCRPQCVKHCVYVFVSMIIKTCIRLCYYEKQTWFGVNHG